MSTDVNAKAAQLKTRGLLLPAGDVTHTCDIQSFDEGCFFFISCKLLIVGGGSAGCSLAAKFASKLGHGQVIILDPADVSNRRESDKSI